MSVTKPATKTTTRRSRATQKGNAVAPNAVASKKQQQQDEEARVAAEQAQAKEQAAADKKAEQEAAKAAKKEEAAKAKAEAEAKARQAKIDNGTLIEVGTVEFEVGTTETKTFGQTQAIIEALKASETPLVFGEVVAEIGGKYPEDLITSMHALEVVGLVRRFDAKDSSKEGRTRRAVAYQWIGDR